MWQKLIAGACVMTGALGFGWSVCREMSCELRHLKTQKQIILYIMGEISYLHRPVEEIFEIAAEKVDKPYNTFLKNVSGKMRERNGKSLTDLWYGEINDMCVSENLSETVLSCIEKMGDCFGCEGDIMQVEALKLFEKELDTYIEEKTAKKEENARLIRALSTLTGILCIILFL